MKEYFEDFYDSEGFGPAIEPSMPNQENRSGHPLESSGQAGSCVFLIFLFKNQVFLLFKLNLNMTTHLVMTSIGVNMHQSPI